MTTGLPPAKRRHAAAAERGKTNSGRGRTRQNQYMNSPNQAIFFLIKFVTSNSSHRAMSRESGSVAAASSGPRRLELAVLTAYLAGETFQDTLACPNPHPRILSALV